jgi:hypothetical protein
VRHLALVTALLVPVAAAVPARADWQVRRTDSSALLERAEQALLERPDDDDLARRLVKLAAVTVGRSCANASACAPNARLPMAAQRRTRRLPRTLASCWRR